MLRKPKLTAPVMRGLVEIGGVAAGFQADGAWKGHPRRKDVQRALRWITEMDEYRIVAEVERSQRKETAQRQEALVHGQEEEEGYDPDFGGYGFA